MKKVLLSLCLVAAFAMTLSAQISTPSASPSCKVEQKVGLTDVTIEYSRPGVKGRTIFAADGLVPTGQLWRYGANRATKITFSDDVNLGGTDVKAGTYAVLVTPTNVNWTFNLYTYESGSWSSYKEKKADVSFSVSTKPSGTNVESFMIFFDNLKDDSADLVTMWADAHVKVPMKVVVDETVMAAIDKTMAGPSKGDMYTAASYYYNSGKDLNKALEWIQKANDTDDKKYWQVRRESQILAKLGKYKEAVAAAQTSMALAEKAGNMEYVKFNKEAIAEWGNMKSKKMMNK